MVMAIVTLCDIHATYIITCMCMWADVSTNNYYNGNFGNRQSLL